MNDLFKNLNFDKFKPYVIAAVCFAAVFMTGFGAGKMHDGTSGADPARRTLSNYTTNKEQEVSKNSTDSSAKNANKDDKTSTASTSKITEQAECHIKGSKSKIYHMPGGSFYDRTNAAQCFSSEEEAQTAGYTKSSR